MSEVTWKTRPIKIASLHMDSKNPRLGRETGARAPRDIIQYLFEHDKAMEVAESIAIRGYFPNEPLLAVQENGRLVVVEGNRRLAALKALREPGLLEGASRRGIERLSKKASTLAALTAVPVTLAPSRRATDKLLAGRHIGTPVLAWQPENRASFILEKLEEGYSNEQLRDELGFTLADIQGARQTRALADMARSLDLPEEVRAKLENPRAKLFTTLERVFDSSVGREFLKVRPDPDHGLRGTTTAAEFLRGFKKLVADIALGRQSSRSLNNAADIKAYFDSWAKEELVRDRTGTFVPADVIAGRSVASSSPRKPDRKPVVRSRPRSETLVPKTFKIRFGSERLLDIRDELVSLRRDQFPNAGAVLMRVFLELAIVDYLQRAKKLGPIVEDLRSKNKLRYGTPELRHLRNAVIAAVRPRLTKEEAARVEKALSSDRSSPFSVADLHSFVHQVKEFPTADSLRQFWARAEPLFRVMLEEPVEGDGD